jgi:hypothetical protein
MEEFEIRNLVGDENHEKQKYRLAEQLLDELVVNDTFIEFLTSWIQIHLRSITNTLQLASIQLLNTLNYYKYYENY